MELSRREFLRLSAIVAAGVVAGCAANPSAPKVKLTEVFGDNGLEDEELMRTLAQAQAGEEIQLNGAQINYIARVSAPMAGRLVEPTYLFALSDANGTIYANMFGPACVYEKLSEWNQGEAVIFYIKTNPNTDVWFMKANTRLGSLSVSVVNKGDEDTPPALHFVDGAYLDMPIIC